MGFVYRSGRVRWFVGFAALCWLGFGLGLLVGHVRVWGSVRSRVQCIQGLAFSCLRGLASRILCLLITTVQGADACIFKPTLRQSYMGVFGNLGYLILGSLK